MMVTPPELDKWDANSLVQLLGVMHGKHKRLANLGDTLDGVKRSLDTWGGEAADAWRAEVGKRRTDIDEQQKQVRSVTDALEPVVDEVGRIITDYKVLKGEVAQHGWKITSDGKVVGDVHGDLMLETVRGNEETELKRILERATAIDHNIAAAIRQAVALTEAPTDPQQPPANDGYTPVTAAMLMQIDPKIGEAKANEVIGPLNDMMRKGGMNTTLRQAAFLSQVAIESDHFITYKEYASGAEYEGRTDLGNTEPGDGVKYKGRGAIQVTGKYNYQKISDAFGVDFVNNPGLLETPQYAFTSALWYWSTHNGNAVADTGDIAKITLMVNGGDHALDERTKVFNNALRLLPK